MLSSPEIWREFFEKYYSREVARAYGELSNGSKHLILNVNVTKDLAIYREGRLMEELFSAPEAVIEHAVAGLKSCPTPFDAWVKADGFKAYVRFYNLPEYRKVLIKDIRSELLSKFVTVEGIVTKVTEVQPKIVRASFTCPRCVRYKEVEVDGEHVATPKCPSCQRSMIMESHETVNAQRISIQDYPERLKGGEVPVTKTVMLEEDLTGDVKPGDRVIVNGVVKGKIRKQRYGSSAFLQVYIDANSIEVVGKEYEEIEIGKRDVERIHELADRYDVVELIKNSIAPSIYGHDEIKLAIALQLFGGVAKTLPNRTTIRGDIHILLVGDPSTAKSALLQNVHAIAPRSVYTSGKGATAAGLTASVTKDEFGKWTIEAGALVLADKGMALIDELDKMRPTDRESIHTALEQQVVPISKAGINATLKSRCSVLASVNPKYGRFDRSVALADQVDLDPALLTRFDLIFLILDEPNAEKDEAVADHVLEVHDRPGSIKSSIDLDLLRKYIAYARRINPKLSPEARLRAKEFYVKVRQQSKESPIQATVRQLEGIIRLAEAAARMRLREVVTVDDVELAIGLIKKSLEHIGIDPETGEVDIDYAFSGISKTQRDKIIVILEIVRKLQGLTDKGAPEDDVLDKAEQAGIDRAKARDILNKLRERGELFTPRSGYYKVVKE